MSPSSTGSDRNPVEALADDFLRRQRGGERPTLEEYCRRHPELADDIREVFPVLIRMEDLRSDGPDDSTGGVAVHTATRLERLGDYRILREVGRGGMGVVYEAEQESLGRRVALKVLPDAALADAQQVLRFQREARAAARLHHTNIVPVFGVGRDDGHHYYVMQFIPGMGLDAVLEELRRLRRGAGARARQRSRPVPPGAVSAAEVAEAILTGRFSLGRQRRRVPDRDHAGAPPRRPRSSGPPSRAQAGGFLGGQPPGASADSLARSDPDRTFFRSVARIGLQVAEALEYANRQGVLHRDVKPSNLLLDPKGNVWVADFGLAKAADAEDITHSGDIVGTVRYMAPERFAGKCDARSDVYALGLTLYELLALRPAFEAADRHELMRRVMSEDPERLRGLVPHLPRDMETIVQKAIDRDPARRYSTAAALAEDLQRFLDDKPIKARRVTAAEQAWRWARRNPAVASLAVGLLLALTAGLAGVSWQWRKAETDLKTAEAANRKAQARFDLAMQAVRAFTTGASEDVMLKEKALGGLRKKLLGQSQTFYQRLRNSLEGETDRSSRSALAEALHAAAVLYDNVDSPQTAEATHREALALRTALAREQPGDPVARRDLGRGHLALADWLLSYERVSEANSELGRARNVLQPLAREHPDDGGARLMEAVCDHLDGRSLHNLGRQDEAQRMFEHSKVLHEQLIRDNPSYTLPTAADGPTEYLRGLADILGSLVDYRVGNGLSGEAIVRVDEEHKAVLDTLVSGPLATDADRRRLGLAYVYSGQITREFRKVGEAIRDTQRGITILRRLVTENPASATAKVELASALASLGVIYADMSDQPGTQRCCLESLSIIRSLTAEHRESRKAIVTEIFDECWLARTPWRRAGSAGRWHTSGRPPPSASGGPETIPRAKTLQKG